MQQTSDFEQWLNNAPRAAPTKVTRTFNVEQDHNHIHGGWNTEIYVPPALPPLPASAMNQPNQALLLLLLWCYQARPARQCVAVIQPVWCWQFHPPARQAVWQAVRDCQTGYIGWWR